MFVIETEIVPSQFQEDSFELYKKYQTIVHKDELSELTKEQYSRFLIESPLLQV
jgi:arginine-tRNA-protein transferase